MICMFDKVMKKAVNMKVQSVNVNADHKKCKGWQICFTVCTIIRSFTVCTIIKIIIFYFMHSRGSTGAWSWFETLSFYRVLFRLASNVIFSASCLQKSSYIIYRLSLHLEKDFPTIGTFTFNLFTLPGGFLQIIESDDQSTSSLLL